MLEETPPPARREFPGADRSASKASGKTTGRETQRGPKAAREQAGSKGESAVLSNERPRIPCLIWLETGNFAQLWSSRDCPDRLWLALLAICAQFARNFAVQHLFQPGQRPSHQGGVGNPVVPAQHDIDGLVRINHAVAEHEGSWSQRIQFARAERRHRGHPKAAEIVGALPRGKRLGEGRRPAGRTLKVPARLDQAADVERTRQRDKGNADRRVHEVGDEAARHCYFSNRSAHSNRIPATHKSKRVGAPTSSTPAPDLARTGRLDARWLASGRRFGRRVACPYAVNPTHRNGALPPLACCSPT